MSAFSRFLARKRVWLFVVMLCLVVGAVLLVPHITINTDMTKYLPDDSPMKQGLDIIRGQVPGMEEQIQSLGSSFGNGNDMMPTNLPRTMAIGVSLLFVVLLVMCSSFMEVLLFLITAISAVILNMGTNALLPSVSMMTNNLAPVLQMVLSMDYSIILMNRYRQERGLGRVPSAAIGGALGGAAPSILSSAFTTIVSLLMLIFIKMKIGADLGVVLAKGVAFSLICNFTVLPALIVWADKSVIFKTKKTPRFPAGAVSRFQMRHRWPLALLFVAIVTGAILFQSRTPIIFAPKWQSKASEHERKDNPLLLLYSTADEAAIPGLMRLMEADGNVLQTISYPTTLGRQCTAAEMAGMMSGYGAEGLPEDFLRIVYYARSHPDGGGKLSFAEIEASAKRLSEAGLMPEEMDFDRMVARLARQAAQAQATPEIEAAADAVAGPVAAPVADEAVIDAAPVEVTPAADTLAVVQMPEEGAAVLTYEDVTLQRTPSQMAEFLGGDGRQISTVFRLAGKARGTMSLAEFHAFVSERILTNKRYAAFVPRETRQRLQEVGGDIALALAAGPAQDQTNDQASHSEESAVIADAAQTDVPLDDTASTEETVAADVGPLQMDEPEPGPTPLEQLMDMAVSGRSYSAAQVHTALSAAGVPVSREDLDLLFLYTLSSRDADPRETATPEQLIRFVADTLLNNGSLQRIVPQETRQRVDSIRTLIEENAGKLRGERYSFALVSTSYPLEGDKSFAFVDKARAAADSLLPGTHFWIGESEMYKELKDAFPSELMLLTILTVLAIYLIVALTFRSLLIPVPLVLSVLTGVYVNVIVSGIGGGTMYYLGYLITQGILMGAAIDYSILFTSYFRDARRSMAPGESIRSAFEGSSHSVLTSGLILILVPMVMSFTMGDPMISSILKSLSIGALAAVSIILLLLPAVLAVLDPIIFANKQNK